MNKMERSSVTVLNVDRLKITPDQSYFQQPGEIRLFFAKYWRIYPGCLCAFCCGFNFPQMQKTASYC